MIRKIPVQAFEWFVYKSQISSWCPSPTPLTSPPTVNGPITVALVGKLSQIVGNLQFMMFPQNNPCSTCFWGGDTLSQFQTQRIKAADRLKKKEKMRIREMRVLTSNTLLYCFTISEAGLATFYDHCRSFNTALYDPCISPTLNS